MKVKKLIELLAECNPESDVEVSMDGLADENVFVAGVENEHPTRVIILLDD